MDETALWKFVKTLWNDGVDRDRRLDDIEHAIAILYAETDESDISAPLKRIRARLEARLGEAGE